MPAPAGRRRGRVAVIAAVLAVAVAAGTAAVLTLGPTLRGPDGGGGPDGSGSGTLPPSTATVTRQTLVDRQSSNGQLGYGDSIALAPRLAGTVTALASIGTVVSRNQVLYRIDDQPVLLLYGSVPAYRALAPDVTGKDVEQLEQNLRDLGYRGFTVDDTYSGATATAVRKWQKDVGLTPTGTVELGWVVFEPGPIRVDGQEAVRGDAAQAGQSLLTYTGTTRVITVELAVSEQRLATADAAVVVRLPSGAAVPGKITGIRTVIKPAEGNNPATTKVQVTVTVDDEKALGTLRQAAVQVRFTASQRVNVLTVPVSALLALAEGGYGVQVVDGGRTRIIAVRTGLFADGRVEVSGDGLADGMSVGVPS